MIQGQRILLVEDSAIQREAAHCLLEDLGYSKVFAVENGVEALQTLQNRTIDLIISDWEMPEMDGLELLKKIRTTPDYSHIPFIILTARDQRNKIALAVGWKVTDYIIKPVERSILKEKLKKILKDR